METIDQLDKSDWQMETQRELGSVEVGEDKFLRIILEVAQHPQQKTHVGDNWPIEQKHH